VSQVGRVAPEAQVGGGSHKGIKGVTRESKEVTRESRASQGNLRKSRGLCGVVCTVAWFLGATS
jgi:hypothetical protein